MTAETLPARSARRVAPRANRERPDAGLVYILARKELRDAARDRWLWLYVGGFAVIAAALGSVTGTEIRDIGFQGFGRATASLVTLAQLVVPLMGLTLGSRSVAGQAERGTLAFLLAHPVSRTEVFLGLYCGNAVAMLAAVAGGFGVAGLLSAFRGTPVDAGGFVLIAALAWLLAVACIGIGMLVSVLCRRVATAIGVALFVWLVLVILGDLGLMGTATATRLPVGTLFASALANPVEAFRVTTMTVLHGSLDVLGPVGSYAVDRFGDGVRWVTGAALVVWAVVPAAAALVVFRRRDER